MSAPVITVDIQVLVALEVECGPNQDDRDHHRYLRTRVSKPSGVADALVLQVTGRISLAAKSRTGGTLRSPCCRPGTYSCLHVLPGFSLPSRGPDLFFTPRMMGNR